MIRSEGENPKVAEIFYRAVTQTVLLFDSKTWFLTAEMEIKV